MSDVSREEFEAVLERLKELEKWKGIAQCGYCNGVGHLTDGLKEFGCPGCEGRGLKIRGRVYL